MSYSPLGPKNIKHFQADTTPTHLYSIEWPFKTLTWAVKVQDGVNVLYHYLTCSVIVGLLLLLIYISMYNCVLSTVHDSFSSYESHLANDYMVSVIFHICLVHWNCRSLYSKLEEVEIMLRDGDMEMFFISETWLTSAVSDSLLDVDGYNMLRLDRDTCLGKNRGGGLLAYTKEDIKAKLLPELCVSRLCAEVMAVQLSLDYTKPIYILCAYRPPHQSVVDFLEVMDSIVDSLYVKANFELNIIGDTNINTLKRNADTKRYHEFMRRHGLSNMIKLPTCYSATALGASLVDHYLTNDEHLYSQSGVCPISLSDHYMIFSARKKFKVKTDKIHLKVRKYKGMDSIAFINDLKNDNWDPCLASLNPSVSWDLFIDIFTRVLDKHAPWRNMTFDNNLPAWVTRELLSEIKQRTHLEKKAHRTNNLCDIIAMKHKRNYITGLKRNLKKPFSRMHLTKPKAIQKSYGRLLDC